MPGKFVLDANGKLVKRTEVDKDKTQVVKDSKEAKPLTIVSTATDMIESEIPMTETAEKIVEEMLDDQNVGKFKFKTTIDGNDIIKGLTDRFSELNIPLGMMVKLRKLEEYHLEHLVDDSGSMASNTDVTVGDLNSSYVRARFDKDESSARYVSRWNEVEDRLHVFIDFISYLPVPGVTIRFFNRKDVLNLVRNGETPEEFAKKYHDQVSKIFNRIPGMYDLTPIRACLQTSFARDAKQATMRYIYTDGEPTPQKGVRSVEDEIDLIKEFVIERPKPESNPITFMSCSNKSDETEWLSVLDSDERCKNCATLDDRKGETRQVGAQQGPVFPYTTGMWFTCQWAAAVCPEDLDALDEPKPLSKYSISELLGRQVPNEEYAHYFKNYPYLAYYAQYESGLSSKDSVTSFIVPVAYIKAVTDFIQIKKDRWSKGSKERPFNPRDYSDEFIKMMKLSSSTVSSSAMFPAAKPALTLASSDQDPAPSAPPFQI